MKASIYYISVYFDTLLLKYQNCFIILIISQLNFQIKI